MIGHQDEGMQRSVGLAQGFTEPMQMVLVILLGKEAWLAIVTTLDNVEGNAIKVNVLVRLPGAIPAQDRL
jgi:hypothetical protein